MYHKMYFLEFTDQLPPKMTQWFVFIFLPQMLNYAQKLPNIEQCSSLNGPLDM